MSHTQLRRGRVAAVVLTAVAGLVLAACGSSSSDGGGSGSVDEAGLAKAKQIVAAGEKRPTEIPITAPITKPIPKGKKVVFIGCGTSTCNLESDIIKQATDALGWSLTTVNTDGTPEKTKAVWQSILRTKPDGVLYTGTDRSVFDAELKQAAKQGIAASACCVTDPLGDGIDFIISKPAENAQIALPLAALSVARTEGKTNALYVDVPALKILSAQAAAYQKNLKELAPSAKVAKLDLPITSLGKDVPDRVVSYLRSHPKVNVVAFGNDGIGQGSAQAMKAAGITDVEYVGTGQDTVTLQDIKSGARGPDVAFPYYEEMFAMVDGLARKFTGTTPITKDVKLPIWIITKDNVVQTDQLYPLVADVKEQFLKLWGVN
jgi:ribose transport system substrate-binding protein